MWLAVLASVVLLIAIAVLLTRATGESSDEEPERDVDDMVLHDMMNEEDEFDVGA